jgi:hypothetical protein
MRCTLLLDELAVQLGKLGNQLAFNVVRIILVYHLVAGIMVQMHLVLVGRKHVANHHIHAVVGLRLLNLTGEHVGIGFKLDPQRASHRRVSISQTQRPCAAAHPIHTLNVTMNASGDQPFLIKPSIFGTGSKTNCSGPDPVWILCVDYEPIQSNSTNQSTNQPTISLTHSSCTIDCASAHRSLMRDKVVRYSRCCKHQCLVASGMELTTSSLKQKQIILHASEVDRQQQTRALGLHRTCTTNPMPLST